MFVFLFLLMISKHHNLIFSKNQKEANLNDKILLEMPNYFRKLSDVTLSQLEIYSIPLEIN